jgi:hypothetical protein
MNSSSLVASLRARGFTLEQRGERLHVEAPADGLLTLDRLSELRTKKMEILLLLRAEGWDTATVADAMGGVSPAGQCDDPSATAPELAAEVCAMRLDHFAQAGRVVTVWSELLRELVIFASDNAIVDPGELRTIYRASELRVLLGLANPRELRQVHAVKRTFRGNITDAPQVGRPCVIPGCSAA